VASLRLVSDVCVPLSNLADLIAQTKEDIDASPLPAPLVAHAGDGNFHAFIMFDPAKKEQVKEAKRLSSLMVQRALAMDGTCTGEHGIGFGKVKYLEGGRSKRPRRSDQSSMLKLRLCGAQTSWARAL
jgi:D-lactate dehydrogenase (cytochrome)